MAISSGTLITRHLRVFYDIQRRRSGEQKLADVFDLSPGLFEMAKEGVRTQYPEVAGGAVGVRG